MAVWTNDGILQGTDKDGRWCWFDDRHDCWRNDTKESTIMFHEYKEELRKGMNRGTTMINELDSSGLPFGEYPNGRIDGFVINEKSIQDAIDKFGTLRNVHFSCEMMAPPDNPPVDRFEAMEFNDEN